MAAISGTTPIATAWTTVDAARIEREVVDGFARDVRTELDARDARVDELRPAMEAAYTTRDARTRRNMAIGIPSALGAGMLVGSVIGAISGPPGFRPAAAGLGAFAGMAFAGFVALLAGSDGAFRSRLTPAEAEAVNAHWQAELDVPHTIGRSIDPPLLHQRDLAASWRPGEVGNDGLSVTIRDYVKDHAGGFDHDADGFVDLAPGSAELRRDAAGGPVSASTNDVDRLAGFLQRGDLDGDSKLSPEEAVRATVREAFTSRSYYWYNG